MNIDLEDAVAKYGMEAVAEAARQVLPDGLPEPLEHAQESIVAQLAVLAGDSSYSNGELGLLFARLAEGVTVSVQLLGAAIRHDILTQLEADHAPADA